MSYRMSNVHPTKTRETFTKRQIRSIYFFFVEGFKTEKIYFNSLSNYSKRNPNIDICLMDRINKDSSNSNQYKITKNVEEYIRQINSCDKKILEELESLYHKYNSESELKKAIKSYNELYKLLKERNLISFSEHFKRQFNALLTMSKYDEKYDKICIIVDRDPMSFKEKQFEDVKEISENNGYYIGLSNPNFEFFLALHLSNFDGIEEQIILKNRRVNRNKKFIEVKLNDELKLRNSSFKKNNYDAKLFFDLFSTGEKNSKKFSSNIDELKNQCGTSLFSILKEIFM